MNEHRQRDTGNGPILLDYGRRQAPSGWLPALVLMLAALVIVGGGLYYGLIYVWK